MNEENKNLKDSGSCGTAEEAPWPVREVNSSSDTLAADSQPNRMSLTLEGMDGFEIKSFCDELERVKEKHNTPEKPCDFVLVTEKAQGGFMRRSLLEVTEHLISAYILEQNT